MSGQDSRTRGVLFFNMDLMLNKHSIFITFPLILLRHTNFVFESPVSILLAEIGCVRFGFESQKETRGQRSQSTAINNLEVIKEYDNKV